MPCLPTPTRARPTPAGRCPGRRRACGRPRPASLRRRAAVWSPERPGGCARVRGTSSRRGRRHPWSLRLSLEGGGIEFGIEARAFARVTGGADLVDLDKQGIAVAVERDRPYVLMMPGGL